MADPLHPTNKEWVCFDLYDSRDPRPPRGVNLLMLNEGGTLIPGHFYKGVRYWAFKPVVPKELPPEFDIRQT